MLCGNYVSRKLRHYFEARHVRVLTNQPLHDIFHNRESSKRMGKWAIELSEYIINFERRSAIKSQILADFITEWMVPQSQMDIVQESPWLVYCDRARGNTRAGATWILTSPSGIKLRYATRLQFTSDTDKCTNNIEEYEAILLGLRKLRAIGTQKCVLRTDSKVVLGQIEKWCIAKEPTLEKLADNNARWCGISKCLISITCLLQFKQKKSKLKMTTLLL
jgi:ribonuclease HI